jgi:hypothetical protein
VNRLIVPDRRPIQTAAIFTPSVVRLENGYLIWDGNHTGSWRKTGALLPCFLELADSDDQSVFRFAKRWGVLNINAQPIPKLHFREPVSTWRDLAKKVRSIHLIGIDLNAKGRGSEEDWHVLGQNPKYPQSSLTEARFCLMGEVRRLVAKAHLQPRLYWDAKNKQWQIDFDSDGRSNLLAVVVMQLMIDVAGNDGYAICSNCKRTYLPGRQPSPSKKNYCDRGECKRAAWRNSKRTLRAEARGEQTS